MTETFHDLDAYIIHVLKEGGRDSRASASMLWIHYALTQTQFTPAMAGIVLTQYAHHGHASRRFKDPQETLRFWVYELLFKEMANRSLQGSFYSTARPLENFSFPQNYHRVNPLVKDGLKGSYTSDAPFTETAKSRLQKKVFNFIDTRFIVDTAFCTFAPELRPRQAVEVIAEAVASAQGAPVEEYFAEDIIEQGEADAMRIIDPAIYELIEGSDAELPLVLDPKFVADLHEAPHVLVAGATGSGKSVALHAMIQGLLVAKAEVWIIDPKTVEAMPYQDVAKVFFRDDAVDALAQVLELMEERYASMMEQRVREWGGTKTVVVIDEYSDLMLGSGKSRARSMEDQIVRIAQMGRAAGIHLILATQRPSADVITGRIKANMPVRLTMKCSSPVDSRIIRGDNRGYDELSKGQGHGLYNDRRVRAPFVDPYPAYSEMK